MPDYHAIAVQAARQYGIPVQIFLRQIGAESGWNPNARSSAGALGIAQFMPGTARGFHIDPFNPRQALYAAAKYDRQGIDKYGNIARALSVYNSGKPDAYLDPHFAGGQTYHYVRSILGGAPVATSGAAPAAAGPSPVSPAAPSSGVDTGALRASALQQLIGQVGRTTPDYSGFLGALKQLRTAPTAASPSVSPAAAVPTNPPEMARPSRLGGGFLPQGAVYKPGRADQGRDFSTTPGGAIIAPGAGVVVRVGSDPSGFGPSYPIVRFTSGPYKGQTMYIGHTLSALQAGQSFTAGQVLSRTGTSGVGNAHTPGWAEIGYAPGGNPGRFGQPTPF